MLISKEKLFLSEAIDYERDIEPYRFITLYAGVGSGKNTFAGKLMKSDEKLGIPKKTVLFITSRKATVEEMLASEEFNASSSKGAIGKSESDFAVLYDDEINWDEYRRKVNDMWGKHTYLQRSVICTNAFIENYLRYCYRSDMKNTHFMEMFDIIIIDEVHDLVTDATYQSAPFYVNSLISEFLYRHQQADKQEKEGIENIDRPVCEKLIIMTGSADPIEDFGVLYEKSIVLDKRDECINVVPQNVHFIKLDHAKKQIEKQIAEGERVIYFSNHTTLPDEFISEYDIPLEKTVVSFSKAEKKDSLSEDPEKSKFLRDMREVEESLRVNKSIPKKFSLFITTSRNKEGINIKDTDIRHVYVESHNKSDIIQMAGRVRSGVENLYIIVNSVGYSSKEWPYEAFFTKSVQAPVLLNEDDPLSVNDFLKMFCKMRDLDLYNNREATDNVNDSRSSDIEGYINFIHSKFSYVRYNYFRNCFSFYYLRDSGMKYQKKQSALFEEAEKDHKKYKEILQEIFPTSNIYDYKDEIDLMRECVENFIADKEEKEYSKEDIKLLLNNLNAIYTLNEENKLYKNRGKLLTLIGYECEQVSRNVKSPGYNRFRLKLKVPEDTKDVA